MADCKVYYDEIRFDVRDDNSTHVYCYVSAVGDCPHMVQGWYHREYPAAIPTVKIMEDLFSSIEDDPMRWEKKTPPDVKYIMYNGGAGFQQDVTPRQG